MKASFFERLGAYLIDTLILTFILAIITQGVITGETASEKKLAQLDEQLLAGEITNEVYLQEYTNLLYDYQKDTSLTAGISVGLTIAYFVVFQYMNKGQTLGKKLLKLRVVDKNTKKPTTIIKGLLRSLFILSIASGVLNLIFIFTLNKSNYYIGYGLILGFELIFSLITLMFILYRKDGRGLHDMMTQTEVIKERG